MGSQATVNREVKEWVGPEEIVYLEFNSLRGRLLSVIESANLPKVQEKALKDLVKNISYQQEAVIRELVRKLDDGRVFKYSEKLECS